MYIIVEGTAGCIPFKAQYLVYNLADNANPGLGFKLHKYKAHFLMSLIPKYYYSVLQLDVKPPLVQLNVLGVVYTATSSFTTTYNFSVTKSDANILASNP